MCFNELKTVYNPILGHRFFYEAYQEAFGTSVLTIAFVATEGGDRRLQQMKTWTREELTKLNAIAYADLFLFTSLDAGCVDGLRLFTAPVFHTLSSSGVALLEK